MASELPYFDMKTNRARLLKPPSGSFFLLGPRGTGKTLWMQQSFSGGLRVDQLDQEVFRKYAARPERLKDLIAGKPDATIVVIDEVQKLPVLLEVVHQLISENPSLRFVLTRSSARKLRGGDANLLGGRAMYATLHPYMASDLGDDFDIKEALNTGLVPIVAESASLAETLRAYTSLYIREEVFAEGLVRIVEQFARFLEAMSFSHGEVQILEDLLLGFRLPIFTRYAKRALSGHPKFYFFDTGVFRALRPMGPLDDKAVIVGHALEGLVVQHLRAHCDYSGDGRRLYDWRTRTNLEIDFVVYGPRSLDAFEVKNTDTVHPNDLRALRAIVDEYPGTKATFLYRGKERLVQHGIVIEPLEPWMRSLT